MSDAATGQETAHASAARRWQLPQWLAARHALLFDLALACVLVVAMGLRLYHLESNPPEIFADELSEAVSGWTIFTTGHDVERTWLPFVVTRLEIQPPLYAYSTVPTQAIFGHGAWGIRLPAVVFGTFSVALLYWLMRVMHRGKGEALLAAGLLAIVPWSVHYGRVGWAPVTILPVVLGGIGLLWSGLEEHRPIRIVAAAILLAGAAYAYHIGLVIGSLLALAVVIVHYRDLTRRDLLAITAGAAAALVVLAPYFLAALTEPLFSERSSRISVFKDGVTPASIGMAWRHYWEQWNPEWLFLSPAQNLRNHPGTAVLFLWMLPFFAIGVAQLAIKFDRFSALVFLWLVIGPVPAALTNDGIPHFTRGLLALPPIVITVSVGLVSSFALVNRYSTSLAVACSAVVVMIAAAQFLRSYRYYFDEYPLESASHWFYGTGNALSAARQVVGPDRVFCTDAIPYWTFWHHIEYYLPDRQFQVLEGVADPSCVAPGAYQLRSIDALPTGPERAVAVTRDIAGRPLFRLVEMGGR